MKRTWKTDQSTGFTTLEIMIVVSVIALLAALALPNFMKSRTSAQNARFVSDLRTATDAFELFALAAGDYPPDAVPANVPSGMEDYLARFNWDAPSSIGGQWDWDNGIIGSDEGVSIIGVTATDTRMAQIDAEIDDGDLFTGLFRKRIDGNGFIFFTGS